MQKQRDCTYTQQIGFPHLESLGCSADSSSAHAQSTCFRHTTLPDRQPVQDMLDFGCWVQVNLKEWLWSPDIQHTWFLLDHQRLGNPGEMHHTYLQHSTKFWFPPTPSAIRKHDQRNSNAWGLPRWRIEGRKRVNLCQDKQSWFKSSEPLTLTLSSLPKASLPWAKFVTFHMPMLQF